MTNPITNFNIRVYGVLIEGSQVLITDEIRSGNKMTKFPGGGLEKGEGIKDCLIREFDEELGISIAVDELFYVNDFLQVSAFNARDQLISFYYRVSTSESQNIMLNQSIDQDRAGDYQLFRWQNLADLNQTQFTFPIDKIVGDLLKMR